MVSQSWGYETGSSRLETVSQGGHSATYSYDPNSIAKKIFIVADENGQTRYYDASSKCWKKIGLDLVENALAADAKGLEQFIAAQNGPSLREQILKDAFLSGDPSIGDWLLYQFFDKLNGAGTLDLASAYYHHDIFSQQSLSDEAATLYALWGGVQLGAASTELVDLGALAKGLFRPSSSARFYDADYMVDLSGYAVAPKSTQKVSVLGTYLPHNGKTYVQYAEEIGARRFALPDDKFTKLVQRAESVHGNPLHYNQLYLDSIWKRRDLVKLNISRPEIEAIVKSNPNAFKTLRWEIDDLIGRGYTWGTT